MSSTECLVDVKLCIHLVGVNRLNTCREFCVCIVAWQNGTTCRDGVKALWYHFHLVWLVFELGFHPYMHLFSFRKLFVTCSCCFVVVVVF